jgi:hypothetical protein
MTESVPEPSVRRTSKFAEPERWKYDARHSITNWRFGGAPRTAVKMPPPVSSVRRSPRYGMKARSRPLIASGMHALIGAPSLAVRNWMLPFELTKALEYGVE